MNILYLMSSANIFGGTPKKTLDLIQHGNFDSSIYFWSNEHDEYHSKFEEAGASVYVGNYGRNAFSHMRKILHVLDTEGIDLIQTQFTMGETLGLLIKLFRPKIKLVIAFVAPFQPSNLKTLILNTLYHRADALAFVSKYVRKNKIRQFPTLKNKANKVIYNGTQPRKDTGEEVITMKPVAILDIAGLSEWKNIQILIKALNIVINIEKNENVFLYVAGDGPYKKELEKLIKEYSLDDHISLLGYISNVGRMLSVCDIFVHPSYAEGFGIAVAEAMHAGKPIIVSNSGALPELIEDEKSGLVVDPHSAEEWAAAILRIINKKQFADKISKNAKKEAEQKFSIESYCKNYENLYKSLTATG